MLLKDLLSSLDALVITTKIDETRYKRTYDQVSKVFASVTPVYSYDVSDEDIALEFAQAFKDGSSKLQDQIDLFGTKSLKAKSLMDFASRKLTKNNILRYSRTESLFRTHKDILKEISEGNKTIVVLEDDVCIRPELYYEDIYVPDYYDVLVIGGNVTPSSDTKAFADKIKPEFRLIQPHKNNGHGAYATVYTPNGAKKCYEALENFHTHLDYARKPALCEWTESYKLVPDLMTVRGHSIRDINIRTENRPVTRSEIGGSIHG